VIKEAIGTLVNGNSLNADTASQVMEEIMDGKASAAQLSAFVTALRIKGETAEEIAGLARMMQSKAIQVKANYPVLDIVGTGGDGLNTFNISTASSFIAAGAGIRVAKHGNRAASSLCGAADVLEKLGVNINLKADEVEKCIQDVGIGFMFAPVFHPAMKYASAPRKEIGIRTVFNILGPLTNPAHAEYQVIGVPDLETAEKIVSALVQLEVKHSLVVHGLNGMDEISITGDSLVWEIVHGKIIVAKKKISPADFGLELAAQVEITGGIAEENAAIVMRVLKGVKGPQRDVVVLNSAAALVAANLASTLQEGVTLSQNTIDCGLALNKLKHLISYSQTFNNGNSK
jgi:anthranilate phosphoribosyltransferase